MADQVNNSSMPDGEKRLQEVADGDMLGCMTCDVDVQSAEDVLARCKEISNHLYVSWTDDIWRELDEQVWKFCSEVQSIHLAVAGLDMGAFEKAISVLHRFVLFVDELSDEIEEHNVETPAHLMSRIIGVRERCEGRIERLKFKLRGIDRVRKAVAAILT